MKRLAAHFTGLVLLLVSVSMSVAGGNGSAFEKIKALAGEWQGTAPDGKAIRVSYEVVSNGSVVMERIMREGEPDMVTMYHMNGEELMLTHYCSAMNQPRMRADARDDRQVSFKMFEVTNLVKPDAGHMQAMVLTFNGPEKITHAWTFKEGDKEMTMPFELTRVTTTQK